MVDQMPRAVRRCHVELFVRRRDRGDRCAELHGELNRRQAHAAARTEHDHLVARLHPRHRTQCVIRRAVGDAERRGGAVVDAVGYPGEPSGGDGDLLGERAVHAGAGDPVADRETVCFRRRFRR